MTPQDRRGITLVVSCGIAVVALAVVAIASLSATGSVSTATASRFPTTAESLVVDAPDNIEAGTAVDIEIRGANEELSVAVVTVISTGGTASVTVELDAGAATAAIPAALTAAAGTSTIWVVAGTDDAVLALDVRPQNAVSPVVPLVGPKSIIADGADEAMVVALPTDRYGNAAADSASTRLSIRRPDGRIDELQTRRTGLVVWQEVFSGTRAGRSEIAMTAGDASGPTADLDEVAGPPVRFRLTIDDRPRQADGLSLHALHTDQLVDRFGNVLPDGTAVTLIIDAAAGRRQATTVTIEGRAEFAVESPAVPGSVRMWAESAGVASDELTVDFEAAVTDWPMALAEDGDRWRVDIGPVRTVDAGFVPDGTVALLTGTDLALEAMIVDGVVRFDLDERPSDDVQVTILGVTQGL